MIGLDSERKVRKQIYLEPEQNRQIKQLSARKGKTEAEIIREAIDNYLITNKKDQADPLLELTALVKKNIIDGSTSHDEAIYLANKGNAHEKK